MQKRIYILVLIFSIFAANVYSQACGYTHSEFYVSDSNGATVKNASFKFNSSSGSGLHSRDQPIWVESKGFYFLREGMCSGHLNIPVNISAPGFDSIETTIALTLNRASEPHVFRIVLKRSETSEKASSDRSSFLKGTIFDEIGALVLNVTVTATDIDGRKFVTKTNYLGQYRLELPFNNVNRTIIKSARYDIKAEMLGFDTKEIKNFVFVPSTTGKMTLDIALEFQHSQ